MSFCHSASSPNSESSCALQSLLKHTTMKIASVFKHGPLCPQVLYTHKGKAPSSSSIKPPKPLLIVHPSQPGEYPLVIFFHGFLIRNVYYTRLFQHIASHGYIIVAPQMYNIPIWWKMYTPKIDATQEVADAVAFKEWLPRGLSYSLPRDVRPDFQKMVGAGHSRGGKVAFGTALDRDPTNRSSSMKFSAIIGIDPVDGLDSHRHLSPPILTHKTHAFWQGVPALVIGSGTPQQKMSPDRMNHRSFFKKCSAPAYHFVAKNCRHFDFLDENFVIGAAAWLVGEACQDREARQRIRSFAGGIIVAFLNAYVKNDYGDLKGVVEDPSAAPVEIEPPQAYVVEKEKTGIRLFL